MACWIWPSCRRGGGSAGSVTKVTSGLGSGSRLGFKGAEDLGGGLSAIFLLESGFQMDTSASGQGGLRSTRMPAR